jgi:hypothetical protein
MSYMIKCSFGEIIDKLTILQIKLDKVIDPIQKINILKEYNELERFVIKNNKDFDQLFQELNRINNKLWILEDTIRLKSKNKEFDEQYIQYAESIHITNDERYIIKRKLNEIFNSDFKEEKIYNHQLENINSDNINDIKKNRMIERIKKISQNDINTYQQTLIMFKKGELYNCKKLLEMLCNKYINFEDSIYIGEIFVSYQVVTTVLGISNKFINKLLYIFDNFNNFFIDPMQINNAVKVKALYYLGEKKYLLSKESVKYMQPVTAKGNGTNNDITPETTGFFKEGDENKVLLIYTSGGLGDKIMFSRFVKRICETQLKNNIIFLIDDYVYWIFNHLFKDISNVILIKFSDRANLPHFDYHNNIVSLGHELGLEYEDIYVDYYLKDLPTSSIDLNNIIVPHKYNIVINWHGDYKNACEKNNRGMNIDLIIPLLKKQNINWISVQKEFSEYEKNVLKKHKVKNVAPDIDNDGDAFKDTLTILKNVDLVLSTDTSLVNFSATADVKTWVMLTAGCEWRWTHDTTSNWYPKAKLFRQKQALDWTNVLEDVSKELDIFTKDKKN